MARDAGGWAELVTRDAPPGTRYRFRIDGDLLVPDPASRFQPVDVHGPSEVVDPLAHGWTDAGWGGVAAERLVFYELHVGAFSPAGTFAGVAERLDHLASLGVTAIELMPVGEFPGRGGWGYDGVLPFAPESSYGRPEDLKALVQACHERGLGVFLDVVYNHFGPEGNYLSRYAPAFASTRRRTPWGDAMNFDEPGLGGRARLHGPQRALLARGVPPRRAAHRRRAQHGGHLARAHPGGAGARGRRRARPRPARPPRARERQQRSPLSRAPRAGRPAALPGAVER